MSASFRFAHLSDWHATTLRGGGAALVRGKRLSGWASWRLGRSRHHDPAILEAAIGDVRAQGVDRVLVTGDLTHVSLEGEFRLAARQLESLGTPEQVFLIPGNHDCYVSVPPEASWDHWAAYLAGDPPSSLEPPLAACLGPAPATGRAPRHEDFPTLRITGPVAAIGLCSSIPTPVFRAGGRLGPTQLERLECLLERLGERGLFRVVMVHHPVAAEGEPARRALWDGEALRAVLARVGAELVIHGHKHRRRVNRVPGPAGTIPVVGVPSTTEVGSRPGKLAQYHVYEVEPLGDAGGFRLGAEIRGYDRTTGRFQVVDEALL